MPRKFLIVSALGAIVFSSSATLLAAGDEESHRGKPSTSKESSGSGDAVRQRGGSAPGEIPGAASGPEARLSDKPAEAERLIENPDKPDLARDRRDGTRPEPGAPGSQPAPGPSVGDRGSEVK